LRVKVVPPVDWGLEPTEMRTTPVLDGPVFSMSTNTGIQRPSLVVFS